MPGADIVSKVSTSAYRLTALGSLATIGLLASCSSPPEPSADASPSSSAPAAGIAADAGDTGADPGNEAAPTFAAGPDDGPVAHYAEALVNATTSDVAIAGSPAAAYLAYLSTMTELTGTSVGRIGDISDDRFTLIQGEGRADVVFDRFERSALGIEDLHIDGLPMAGVVSVLQRPVRDGSGVEVERGYSFTSFGTRRIIVLQVTNSGAVPVTGSLEGSTFVEVSGHRSTPAADQVGAPVELAPGTTAEIIHTFPRGDADPDGLLEHRFITTDGEFVLPVPLGDVQPTFFELDDDGNLAGRLDADIAFEVDTAALSPTALDTLFKAAQEIESIDPNSPVCVAGHADSVGEEGYNLDLSQRRAQAVADTLSGYGVPNRLTAVGYGEAFAPGDEVDSPEDRRVDVTAGPCPDSP